MCDARGCRNDLDTVSDARPSRCRSSAGFRGCGCLHDRIALLRPRRAHPPSYYIAWNMTERLASVLLKDDDRQTAEVKRTSPTARSDIAFWHTLRGGLQPSGSEQQVNAEKRWAHGGFCAVTAMLRADRRLTCWSIPGLAGHPDPGRTWGRISQRDRAFRVRRAGLGEEIVMGRSATVRSASLGANS